MKYTRKVFALMKLLNSPAQRMTNCFVLTSLSFDANLGPPGQVKDKRDIVSPTRQPQDKISIPEYRDEVARLNVGSERDVAS
jgi:hypothetical protein